jgi:hypothetical protein
VAGRLGDAPRALNLIDATVDNDHLAVQVGKRAQATIPVLEERLNAHLAIVYASNERARG